MTQHAIYTPGPWKVDGQEQYETSGARIFKIIADRPYGGLIGQSSAWWVDTESAEANARLFAIAPAMYQALIDVESELIDADMEVPEYIKTILAAFGRVR